MESIVVSRKLGDIPFLEVFCDDKTLAKPLVIVQHGWTSKKEDMLSVGYHLAQNGFFVILPDAWEHGERKIAPVHSLEQGESLETHAHSGEPNDHGSGEHDVSVAKPSLPVVVEYILSICDKTAADFNSIIASYQDRNDVDSNKVAITGASMGGIITFRYLLQHSKSRRGSIKAAIPMICAPLLHSVLTSREELNRINENMYMFDGDLSEELLARTAQQLEFFVEDDDYRVLEDVPILMLNGNDDPLFSMDTVRESLNYFESVNERAIPVTLLAYDNTGHEVTPAMCEEAARWLKQYF